MKREVKKILPTMKIDAKNENDLAFKEVEGTITQFYDVETKFGTKTICDVQSEEIGEFAMFVNNFSMEKLIEAYGDEDKNFIGKVIQTTKEVDKTFNKEMIVIKPVN